MKNRTLLLIMLALLIVNVIASVFYFRIDLTAEKRHSIGQVTHQQLGKLTAPMHIVIYLDGDLNAGFEQLKRATTELLDEMRMVSREPITYELVNPSAAESQTERNETYSQLVEKGMQPTVIHDKDHEGKSTQKIIFPWAEVRYNGKTQSVLLLKNTQGYSGTENLNSSIETLEYEFADVLRILTRTQVESIAFIEGHGELDELHTYDISKTLSRYYQIDRGVLGNDPAVLNTYKAIIIADPQTSFSESDKFIIDQYLMQGGSVLWLVNGVRFDDNSLSTMGISPAMPLELNLTDILFRYGVRINPVLVQDEQCLFVPVDVSASGAEANFQPMPWHYAPLLLTSPHHAVSKGVTSVKSQFVSTIDFVGNDQNQQREVLLATSNASHITSTPNTIDFRQLEVPDGYFNAQYLPVGVVIEGVFESLFSNRLVPENIVGDRSIRKSSVPTKQIFIANGEVIRNEIENGNPLPVGFDRYSRKQFGNRDLLQNALLYLADDAGYMHLRNKDYTIRLLNKRLVRQNQTLYRWLNIGVPLVLLLLLAVVFTVYRRRRYTRE